MEKAADGKQNATTLAVEYDADFFQDLAEYLDVLGNPLRLMILKSIKKEPKDIREIAAAIGATYENTKKHLYRLLSTGLVLREAGLGSPTPRGIHPVWKFSLAPRAMDELIRNLGLFGTIRHAIPDEGTTKRLDLLREGVARTLSGYTAALIVVSGPDDGCVFPLAGDRTPVGRRDRDAPAQEKPDGVVLSSWYATVTRISRPHATLSMAKGKWYIRDCGSTTGTMVNGIAVREEDSRHLQDGDLIELGKGPTSAWLTFLDLGQEA